MSLVSLYHREPKEVQNQITQKALTLTEKEVIKVMGLVCVTLI